MTEQELASFSKFGKHFQEKLVQLIVLDRGFSNQIQEVLDLDFLEFQHLRVFLREIFEYKREFKVHPTLAIIDTIVNTQLERESPSVVTQINQFIIECKNTIEDIEEAEFIKKTSIEFCKKQKLKSAILQSVPLLKNASFEEIQRLLDDALKLGNDTNYGHNYVEDFEARYQPIARDAISTGWPEIDKIVRGGYGKRELSVVISSTGGGKSMCLVHSGAAALKQDRVVVYYTLELPEETIGKRFDSCLTDIPLDDLYTFKDEVYDKIKKYRGNLIIKEYPARGASTRTIENHLERLLHDGIKPSMVIVDYGDLLKPVVSYRNQRTVELEHIYEELRAIAQKLNLTLLTASQSNRTGSQAEVITMETIADAYSKCFCADYIYSISNRGKVFVAKNRNGKDGMVFPVVADFSRVSLEILPADEEIETIDQTLQGKMDTLREKYKKFKVS